MLIEEDVDALTVTLGPSQGIVAWGGLPVLLAAMGVGGSLAFGGHMFVGGAVWSAGLVVGSAMRIRGWTRHEAPLELVFGPRALELRRVYRSRRLHTEAVSWSELRGCSAHARGLELQTDGGSVRLVCGFRTAEELDWVVQRIEQRMAAWRERVGEGAAEIDDRLTALRQSASVEAAVQGAAGSERRGR